MTAIVNLEREYDLLSQRAFWPWLCFLHAFLPEPKPTRKLSYINAQFNRKGNYAVSFRAEKMNNYEANTY